MYNGARSYTVVPYHYVQWCQIIIYSGTISPCTMVTDYHIQWYHKTTHNGTMFLITNIKVQQTMI